MTRLATDKGAVAGPWLPVALIAAITYPAIGIGFAFLDSPSAPLGVPFWRLAAWLASAVVFGAHVVYEQQARPTSPLRVACHVSTAVGLGAFVLAVWVLAHGRLAGARHSPLAPLSLVLFPLVTGIPAFAVTFVAAALATKIRGTHR